MNSNLEKKWLLPDITSSEIDQNLKSYPRVFRQILFNRGIYNEEDANRFLYFEYELPDTFLFQDMRKAVALILQAVEKNQTILIFGDYDVDGITATALMVQTIRKLFQHENMVGGGRVKHFIPNRFEQGYGLSMAALEQVLENPPDLMVTVDCGVRSFKEVELAKQKGISVIITDHHLPNEDIPPADAILCPKLPGEQYPNQDLAGVGIAYKLAQALDITKKEINLEPESLLDLVALGTIADIAKLSLENRKLVSKGLSVMHTSNRPGLISLAAVSGFKLAEVTAEDIGFRLGPRLNAPGRMETAEAALSLLLSPNIESSAKYALHLDQLNRSRQDLTHKMQEKVEEVINESKEEYVLFYAQEDFNIGVVGLVASRLAEKFYRPAIIGGIDADGMIHASCRSVPEIDITRTLDRCSHLLIQHGGHAMAAGLTLACDSRETFISSFSKLVQEEIKGRTLQPVLQAECDVSFYELDTELLDWLEKLEPTGQGNPQPLFITRNVQVESFQRIGLKSDHLRLRLKELNPESHGSLVFNAIAFRMGDLAKELHKGCMVDILFSFELNKYNGRSSLQLKIRDLRLRASS